MKKLSGLYVITDEHLIPEKEFISTVENALKGGASIVQYRDKSQNNKKRMRQAKSLQQLCADYQATFIINDDIRLCVDTQADGVHIGIDDTSLNEARKILGPEKIIGVSCYNNFSLALKAQEQGADYIAFGSFFSSSTKPQAKQADFTLLERSKKELTIPVCAIGGITSGNASQLISAGANMLAVINDIFSHVDAQAASQKICRLFD